MELGIKNLERGGGREGKGKMSNSVYEIVVRSRKGGMAGKYIYIGVFMEM